MSVSEGRIEGRANRPGEPRFAVRKPLRHDVPSWVKLGSLYFITVCCADRTGQPLLQGSTAAKLTDSARHLHQIGRWYAQLFLVMPDHVHGLVAVPPQTTLGAQVAAWKGYTRKAHGVRWQERFFDHRLRSDEALEEKANYIRLNPVRAGLVASPQDWPHVFSAADCAGVGSAGTPRPTC